MTKVLILDPFHKVDDLSEFKALAHLHCEWDFTRLSFEMSQSSPRDYLRVKRYHSPHKKRDEH
jgi:hypothetical protein